MKATGHSCTQLRVDQGANVSSIHFSIAWPSEKADSHYGVSCFPLQERKQDRHAAGGGCTLFLKVAMSSRNMNRAVYLVELGPPQNWEPSISTTSKVLTPFSCLISFMPSSGTPDPFRMPRLA